MHCFQCCIVVPSNSNPSSNSAIKGTQSVENSKSVTRTTTRGPLLCETSQICPELAIDWTKQQGKHHISAYIYSSQKIDLNEFTFVIYHKKYSFSPLSATSYHQLNKSDMIDSSNTVQVPSSLLSRFKNANDIQVVLSTNQGERSYAMLNNGKPSKAYRLFLRAY